MTRRISRREFLAAAGATAGVAALTACGAPQAAPTKAPDKAAATAAPAAKGPEPLTLPIVKEPLTLSYWVELSANVSATKKNLNEVTMYQELEKRTGVHIDFQHAASGQGTEQFNLLVASQKYPDIIEHGNWPTAPGGPAKYIKDGVIIRLNDLIDQYAPNLKKVLTDHPDWRKQIVNDEGDIYCFPFLRGDVSLMVFQGPIVRKDWLDKLGLQVPTTIDEWYTVLKAVKEKDPNGNGKADEVPFTPFLYSNGIDGWRASHAFVGAWGIAMEYYNDKGTVKYGMLQPQFKEFLTVMAKWYKEGLIDPDFVSMDQKMEDAKVTGNQLFSIIQNTGGGIGKFLGLMAQKDPNFNMVAAPYPVLKKGDKPVLGQRDFVFTGVGAAITTANKKVKETVKWLDYAYSPDGHMLFNFGVEGVSYTMVNGYPKYTDAAVKDPKLPLAQSMAQFFRSNYSGPFVQDKRYFEQYAALPQQQESIKVWTEPSNEMLMPPVTPTQDESKKFASIMNDVNTLRSEAVIKVVTGAQPVTYWDQVVSQMKQMGIEDALKIQQAALDRYNKR